MPACQTGSACDAGSAMVAPMGNTEGVAQPRGAQRAQPHRSDWNVCSQAYQNGSSLELYAVHHLPAVVKAGHQQRPCTPAQKDPCRGAVLAQCCRGPR